MYLYNKDNGDLWNLDHAMQLTGNSTEKPGVYMWIESRGNSFLLKKYDSATKATTVIKMIYDALKSGEEFFDLPENWELPDTQTVAINNTQQQWKRFNGKTK